MDELFGIRKIATLLRRRESGMDPSFAILFQIESREWLDTDYNKTGLRFKLEESSNDSDG